MSLQTSFTKAFNLEIPIIGAPMAGVSGPALTAAVARAGGLGLLGAAIYTEPQLRKEFAEAQQLADGKGAVGIGLAQDSENFSTALDLRPHTIWLSVGAEGMAERIKAAGIKLIYHVQSIQQAEFAIEKGADAIVAQGFDSGERAPGACRTGTISFGAEVVDAVARTCAQTGTPAPTVLAAGGITDGRQVAAALALGAAGAVLGAPLAATEESLYPTDWRVIHRHDDQEIRIGFGEAMAKSAAVGAVNNGTFAINFGSWLYGQHRLRCPFCRCRIALHDTPAKIARMSGEHGWGPSDDALAALWCGTSVGLHNSVQPAEGLVRGIVEDAKAVIAKLAQLVSDDMFVLVPS